MFENRLLFFKAERYAFGAHHRFDTRKLPRPHFCMGLVLSGEGTYHNAETGEAVRVSRGDLIFVPQGCRYLAEWTGGEGGVSYVSLHFCFASPALLSREGGFVLQRVTVADLDSLLADYEYILSHHEEEGEAHLAVLARFYAVLSRIYPLLLREEHPATDERIRAALHFMEEHFAEPISVEQLAAVAGMSEPRFYPAFKAALGVSPVVYLNRLRVERAILLLLSDPEEPIERISDAVGFSSATYFRRVFRAATGKTPRAYRSDEVE